MTNNSEIIGAVDIGTTKIVALAGRKTNDGRIEVIGFGTSPSKGIRRGVVLNIDETVTSIKSALKMAFDTSGIRLDEVFIGIAGQHVLSHKNRCNIKIDSPDKIIKKEDLIRLEKLMRTIVTEPGEEIIEIIPQSYIIDKTPGIENPISMSGSVLEGNFHIITGQMTMVNNIRKCANLSGLKIKALFLEPLASAYAVLTPFEKESGVAMLDIGGGTSDLAIYLNNKVIHTAVIPIGGNTITNDIKNYFSILENEAEQLKIKYGNAVAEKNHENTLLELEGPKGREPRNFSLYQLNETIQARMEEIIHAVKFQIESAGIFNKLPGGIVITGGGSLLKNIKQLASYITNNDIRIAYPSEYIYGPFSEDINKPQYSTAIGLLLKGLEYNEKNSDDSQDIEEIISKPVEQTEKQSKKNLPKDPDKKFIERLKSKMSRLFDDDDNDEIKNK